MKIARRPKPNDQLDSLVPLYPRRSTPCCFLLTEPRLNRFVGNIRLLSGLCAWLRRQVMLVVLPFENLTGDPNKEYLADGLTEETIS
jgi:hypothetical protein